jgi:hypothetical protein
VGMKESYEQKLQAQLDEWGSKIDTLKAKEDKAWEKSENEFNNKK